MLGTSCRKGGFLLVLHPSAVSPGEETLKWGRWTDALEGMGGHVEACPGYDFSFRLWVVPDVGTSERYVVGVGVAMTRRR